MEYVLHILSLVVKKSLLQVVMVIVFRCKVVYFSVVLNVVIESSRYIIILLVDSE